ncbi:hypothetical protein ASPWEDRAFT_171771 [Aspergillus wentii DTO 134E9]|uniref:Zn(2)-C6 fungal-type domain-containing protein n=1 Tax=Aspergillus wentii DTO 134E9 TaxID=1073089 RepID=A0A1L9RJ29_ASPWE|nr:uncharacterized protein ASPWEDRAFT_171771 [Aspergillus wentii DTO 134E9]OJJ34940.1 hypothetical protein ASPWEDRAFT_171771 [Aspergillus wentii DTO 134E9]
MSRQPKLRPKSHIPGFPEGLYDLATIAPLSELESRQGFAEDKREQRVFRVKRKHVLKACDRCRVKKTKCDGKQPCNRCSAYNHPCLFRERKATQTKVYSRGFVEMLESHHSLVVKALQKLYKHCVNKEGFPGEPLAEGADGHPLTHAILDRLGLIKQAEENPDEPDEETEDLQYLRFLSTSTDSTTDPSPEPTTPPDPYPSNCASVTASPRGVESWKWDFQSVQPEQYHNYSGSGYPGMVVSQAPLGPTNLAGEVACPQPIHPAPSSHPPYLYYPNNSCYEEPAKHRLHPSVMTGPGPHQTTAGLSADVLGEYHHFQEQPLYPGVTPGWHFPSG